MDAPRYNIDTSALLVELCTSVWTARKLDRGATDELVTNKKAGSKEAARVNKNLLAGRPELERIVQHVGNVRNRYFYPRTLPWSDTGLRLLPSISFMEFNARMEQEAQVFHDMVEDFVHLYPTLITAQAMALGDMFNRNDYPTVDEIRHKFDFRFNYMPVPTSGDFRVDVGNAAAQELKAQFERYANERVEHAMSDVRQRMKEHLKRMSDRLTSDVVQGEVKTRRFHDSLLETGFELCDLVKELNLTQDPDLEHARKALELTLSGVSVDELRKNHAVRNDVKKGVDEILSKFNW